MSIINAASRVAFCFISSRVIKSFGAKPVWGGRPARESKISIVFADKSGVLGYKVEISDIFVVKIVIRDINMAAVKIIYSRKVKRAHFKKMTIHQRWLI